MLFRLGLVTLVLSLIANVSFGFATPQKFESDTSPLKALVFVSSSCPCSRSHIEHLNQLNKDNPDLQLFAVITDPNATATEVLSEYYSPKNFQFSIIQDSQQSLVKKYRALKTPHVVLLERQKDQSYKMIYEGGVSNHRTFAKADKKFLAENLQALSKNQPLPYQQGRSLGCYIRRL
jgi:hypothetical protein